MLKTVDYLHKRKADILTLEGSYVIAKSPIKLANNTIDIPIKLAASFHGQISRDSAGDVDVVAEMRKHPEALWLRVKAIEADIPNDNGDCFSREEIVKSYKTFEGVPVFTNHENNKVENAKGKVVKAEWDDKEGAVYCTMYIDKKASPSLCRAIEEGYVTDVSMGTQVDFSVCSICDRKAQIADQYCDHVKTLKGRMVDGKRVYEKNYGLKFIEISVVTDGACKDCTIREVIDPGDFLSKVAAAVRTIKQSGMIKDGGQVEIQKLNQAMDLLEDVCRAMLDQRQYIDLEFLNKVAEVLSDLQHVNDELVDQGYGRVGEQQNVQQQMGIPPLPENSAGATQEQAAEAPKPFLSGPANFGVGTVTEPATASSAGKSVLASRIKDLHERVTKIYEEKKISSTGGDTAVDKASETISKLAKIWENPSVKNYEWEMREGDYKVIFTPDEIVGLMGGQKVASLKKADLDQDVKDELKKDPHSCGKHLLDALKGKFASKQQKTAGYTANVDEKSQHEMTMEAQLRTQNPDMHPRTGEVRESTTEKQLGEKHDEYEYNKRTGESRDSITEKQLDSGRKGYEDLKRQEEPRDEITDKQLRNEGWKGNTTPAGSDSDWAAGVKDQKEQITEGQLNDWKKSDKRHCPTDSTTEKQLANDSENWGRRIASKDDAKKAYAATLKAIAKTSIATGATPEEMLAAINDMTGTPHNQIAAIKTVASLSGEKETRTAMLRRSKFHGSPKTASSAAVCDYMLGSISDEGMTGEVGIKVLASLASQKDATARISDAITAGAAIDHDLDEVFSSNNTDYLREVIAESSESGMPKTEDVLILLKKASIKADEKNTEAFAAEAYAMAIKQAENAGIKVTDKVHVSSRADGQVEVALHGVKTPKEAATQTATVNTTTVAHTIDLGARKEAREKVAQLGGAMPDMGMGGAPGAQPGAGAAGGTTMPPPPGGGDPAAGMPPVAGLGAPETPAGDESDTKGGEALPPGSICPVCGTDNIDIRHGEFTCNDCGASGEFSVKIKVNEWPDVIEDTEPKKKDGGIGDMGGGEGMEMPPVGMAAAFKITKEMVKIAGNKPVGSFCPHCASSNVKMALKGGCGNCECNHCGGSYKVDTYADLNSKSLWGRIEWNDMRVANDVKEENKARKEAAKQAAALAIKKASLEKALRDKGMTAKFAKADLGGKAMIIARLADDGIIPKE